MVFGRDCVCGHATNVLRFILHILVGGIWFVVVCGFFCMFLELFTRCEPVLLKVVVLQDV